MNVLNLALVYEDTTDVHRRLVFAESEQEVLDILDLDENDVSIAITLYPIRKGVVI